MRSFVCKLDRRLNLEPRRELGEAVAIEGAMLTRSLAGCGSGDLPRADGDPEGDALTLFSVCPGSRGLPREDGNLEGNALTSPSAGCFSGGLPRADADLAVAAGADDNGDDEGNSC